MKDLCQTIASRLSGGGIIILEWWFGASGRRASLKRLRRSAEGGRVSLMIGRYIRGSLTRLVMAV